jgi:dolichyl-phosphate-mannose-protein mannosyltransferase
MTKKWFQIGIAGIFLLSLALRFWGLGRFNTLVFDEVYYAKFGNDYLTHTPFFDGHPPLAKCIIAIGIWLGSHVPFWQDPINGYTGSQLSPWSYRWINAFSGSFIPIIVAGVAYQLTFRRSFALLAGLFTACDGLFLVESRYALINIYIVLFGMLGQLFLLLALNNKKQKRWFWLVLSGIGFGASIAVKWNGLWFLLGAYSLWIVAWGIRLIISKKYEPEILDKDNQTPLQNLTQLNIFQVGFNLGVIPVLTYIIAWIPHLRLDTKYGFIEVHKRIFEFHERLGGNNADVHPYCAAWYKWPLMTRPMAYFYQTARSINEPLPVMGPPLPSGAGKIYYDVHAMGNPFLWWCGLAAIAFLLAILGSKIARWFRDKRFSESKTLGVDAWIALYLVINYAVNLLPWVKVSRCVFVYHYMTALVFVFLAIAWFVDQCIRSYYKELRIVGVTITFAIIAAFIFWMPIYLGLPITPGDYRLRMWFNSWI